MGAIILFSVLMFTGIFFDSDLAHSQGVIPIKALGGGDPKTISEIEQTIAKPTTKITIPGLSFSQPKASYDDADYFLSIPFLGEYISHVYQWLVATASVVAVLVIIISGLIWVTSAGNAGKIDAAKKRIGGALIGLFLALGSYTILFTVSPDLVTFQNIKVLYVQKEPFEVLYAEGDPSLHNVGNNFLPGGPKPSVTSQCLLDTFAPGKKIGDKVDLESITLFGIRQATVNKHIMPYLRKVHEDMMKSTDPEVIGYLQWMKDIHNKKSPDLMGQKDSQGVYSYAFSKYGIGYSRHSKTVPKPVQITGELHSVGLALDVMTRSNWDIYWGPEITYKTKKMHVKKACNLYKSVLQKMKDGSYGDHLKSDPYKMYDRLDKQIASCLNNFNNGTMPFTSMPDEFINIFIRNGFYWGGYGWSNRKRSDAMHFEYLGNCNTNKIPLFKGL